MPRSEMKLLIRDIRKWRETVFFLNIRQETWGVAAESWRCRSRLLIGLHSWGTGA